MKVIFDFDYSIEVVDKKLYDKLEAKHEADCRLISEYDLEIKKLEKRNDEQNGIISDLYSKYVSEEKEHFRCEAVIEGWKKRYNELEYIYEKKDAENNKLEDEINTLNKQIDSFGLTCRLYDKERDEYKELFHSLNHKHQNVVGEMKAWKERAIEAEKPDKLRPVLERENKALRETLETVTKDRDKLKSECYIAQENLKITKEKYDDACKMNKMREDVFEANLKLKKTIEAKDREIDLLRAELDKYKTDNECDDRWID